MSPTIHLADWVFKYQKSKNSPAEKITACGIVTKKIPLQSLLNDGYSFRRATKDVPSEYKKHLTREHVIEIIYHQQVGFTNYD